MGYSFHDWFGCPDCGASAEASALAYKTEFVFECHDCGRISEFAIGDDVPLNDLDGDAIVEKQSTD